MQCDSRLGEAGFWPYYRDVSVGFPQIPGFGMRPFRLISRGVALAARSFLLTCLLGFLMTLGVPGASAAPIKKTVLMLFPFQHDLPMHVLAVQALREEFARANDFTLDLYDEFLDLNRFPERAYKQQLIDLYAAKYRNKPVDLVIVQSEEMLNLWLEQRGKLLPDTPVVFFDTLTESVAARQLPRNVTGVCGTADLTKSLEWFLRMQPSVNEIVLVQGVGALDKAKDNYLPVEILKKEMGGKVRITDLSGFSLAEIKRRVAILPKSSVVVSNVMFEDAAGVKYRPIDAVRELVAASSVPVITAYDHLIGTGIIGGYMYSVDAQAREAARIGLRILRGESAGSIPRTSNRNECFIFDHLALQRFGIPLSVLPPESIIKNRQYSFWEEHRPQILAALSTIAVLVLLVFFLREVTRRLNRTRHALAHLNANLETQVEERTLSLRQANRQLEENTAQRLEQQARLLAVEEERKHLSRQHRFIRDLHDGLGAISANVGLLAERGRREAQQDGKDALFGRISHLAQETSLEVRSLMDSMETSTVGWGEIIENCRCRAALAFDPVGVRWDVTVSGSIPDSTVPSLAGLSLLRLFREATNNILKHAHARSVCIHLQFTPERCGIAFQDDGCGFHPDPARPGRGLKNMRQRVEEMGGTMRLETGLCENQKNMATSPKQGRPCPRYPLDSNGATVVSAPLTDYVACGNGEGVRLVFEIPLPVALRQPPTPLPQETA